MRKSDLAAALADQFPNLSRNLAKDMIDKVFETIEAGLQLEGSVTISGFGTFVVRDTPSRPGRHPRTGASIVIPRTKRTVFRPSPRLRDAMH